MTDPGEMRFDDVVVVITGAGTGLGRAHAELLARRGASVVVNDIDGNAATAVADQIASTGGRAQPCDASVADEVGAARIVASAIDTFGRVDALINNAGLLISKPFEAVTLADWQLTLDVSLTGSFLVSRAVWPSMIEQGGGRIVFTTSNSGLLGTAGSVAYAAAKAGLWGLMRTLSLEGAEHGIGVNALAPMAYTAMSARSRIAPEAWRDGSGDAWSRRLDVDLVAPVAAWLCHQECPLRGEVLSAAGGRVARYFLGLTPGIVHDDLQIENIADELERVLDTDDHRVLAAAFQEGRDLHRRLMGR